MPFPPATPVVKPKAFDPDVLKRKPVPADFLVPREEGERELLPDPAWMECVDPAANLTFAGYRAVPGELTFCLVLRCDPAADSLVLLPLRHNQSPLTALAECDYREDLRQSSERFARGAQGDVRSDDLISVSLRQAIDERRIGPPVPPPRHVFAVAANYPSHLEHDLAIDLAGKRETLMKSRARVFVKYPPVPPPGEHGLQADGLAKIVGPYDGIAFPEEISLPGDDEARAATCVDYEAEIGVVMGRSLAWNDIRDAEDGEIWGAVAGSVLVGDTKARNPQVANRVRNLQSPPDAPEAAAYRTGDCALDRGLGVWGKATCHWWSYAASWGEYTSVGPFFVATPGHPGPGRRALVCARTYGPADERGVPAPPGRVENTMYLRQCAVATEDIDHHDGLIWSVPQIVRSILAPGNALGFMSEPPRLEPGDIICLGTPGGVVITSKSAFLFAVLRRALFWWDAERWHDKFFANDAGLYLHPGDEVFFWAEGLGFQRQQVRRLEGH